MAKANRARCAAPILAGVAVLLLGACGSDQSDESTGADETATEAPLPLNVDERCDSDQNGVGCTGSDRSPSSHAAPPGTEFTSDMWDITVVDSVAAIEPGSDEYDSMNVSAVFDFTLTNSSADEQDYTDLVRNYRLTAFAPGFTTGNSMEICDTDKDSVMPAETVRVEYCTRFEGRSFESEGSGTEVPYVQIEDSILSSDNAYIATELVDDAGAADTGVSEGGGDASGVPDQSPQPGYEEPAQDGPFEE